MAACDLTGAINLAPDCTALRKTGGIDKRIWVGSNSEVSAYTFDPTTKELKTLVMKTGKKVLSASGRKYKNSATTGVEQTENGPLYPHVVNFVAYYSTQVEKEDFIEKVAAIDDLFVVVENNWGKLEAYGLVASKGKAEGMTLTGSGGTGVNAEDATNLPLTFTGKEDKLPVFASFGATLADDISYMDTLLVAAA